MTITIWGTRGSLPAPSPENNHFGGNTSCVSVEQGDTILVLDAGSGIRRLGNNFPPGITQVDILLTHLHLDHILGLGFFLPLYNPAMRVNIYGPTGHKESLLTRLQRYLSPPLFPIRLQDLPSRPNLIEINESAFDIGPFHIKSSYICHPGPTLGFRVENEKSVFAYMPDHEPALGSAHFPSEPAWTSGYALAQGADLLLHDAQYTEEEYRPRVGWGHSTMSDALKFAELAAVKKMLFFHHDPSHSDERLQQLQQEAMKNNHFSFKTGIAAEGDVFYL